MHRPTKKLVVEWYRMVLQLVMTRLAPLTPERSRILASKLPNRHRHHFHCSHVLHPEQQKYLWCHLPQPNEAMERVSGMHRKRCRIPESTDLDWQQHLSLNEQIHDHSRLHLPLIGIPEVSIPWTQKLQMVAVEQSLPLLQRVRPESLPRHRRDSYPLVPDG